MFQKLIQRFLCPMNSAYLVNFAAAVRADCKDKFLTSEKASRKPRHKNFLTQEFPRQRKNPQIPQCTQVYRYTHTQFLVARSRCSSRLRCRYWAALAACRAISTSSWVVRARAGASLLLSLQRCRKRFMLR